MHSTPNSDNSNSKTRIAIPARLASTRLPRKLLLCETGKTLIQHTYEAASRSKLVDSVCVACDHAEIFDEVRRFGGDVVMTDPAAPSGTDRVAEAAADWDDVDIVVNVQGDEPELSGESIDLVIRLLQENPDAVMSTLAVPIHSREMLNDPSCVKVVFDSLGRAMYFSRSPIPAARDWNDVLLEEDPPLFHQHVGLYAYRRDFLLELAQMLPARVECLESLEQLRVLDAGRTILVGVVDEATVGIDTPEDYARFVERTKSG
jgi:3-deoxy-manno-octulosonate cytidylyltransferase (CMP-KDO synthetase)